MKMLRFATISFLFLMTFNLTAQVGGWKIGLVKDAEKALQEMTEKTPKLKEYKDQAYGYAVFPKVTKAAFAVGGAAGQGVVYRNGEIIGTSKLKSASFGLQFGGQQYKEVLFFKNKEAFDKFINGKLKFDGQASVVAITPEFGASVDLAWNKGMAVFTQTKGGLMYEASIGGQHFQFIPKEEE